MSEPKKVVSVWYRRAFEVLLGIAILALIAAISVPNLLRSRMAANSASRYGYARSMHVQHMVAAGFAEGEPGSPRKVASTVTLDLVAKDAQQLTNALTKLTADHGGYIQSSEIRQVSYGPRMSTLVRIPAARLNEFLAAAKSHALRVETEAFELKDVTADWVDLDARLRNARHEEEQYLAILRRTGTVSDTVKVAESVARVRERIEQMEGQMRLLNHQVEMATISITIAPEVLPQVARLMWHPWVNLRNALIETGQGLADYTDAMLAFAVKLPVIGLWVITVIAVGSLSIRVLIWMWFRWLRRIIRVPQPVAQT
jgi:hypothetical protein